MKSATRGILELLLNGETITPVKALGVFGIIRLGAIIYTLRKQGWRIVTTMQRDARGHEYAEYSIPGIRDAA